MEDRFLQLGDLLIIILQIRLPCRVQALGAAAKEPGGGDLRRTGHIHHEGLIDLRQAGEGIGMILEGILRGEQLEAEGRAEAVLLLHGLQDAGFLALRPHGQDFPEVRHLQGRDVRLKDQLGDVGRGGGALLELLPDMLQLRRAPVGLPDHLLLRELASDETEDPGMMDADEGAVTEIRVDIIILRETEIRIVQIRDEGEGRSNALCTVHHQEALEAAGIQGILPEGLIQQILLPAYDDDGQGAAVETGPADGGGDFGTDGVAGLQAAEGHQLLRGGGGREGIPGASHILRRHVDNTLGQPGFPVEGGEEIRVGSEAGADPGAGRDEIGSRAEEGRRIGVGIRGCGARRLIFLPDFPVPVFCAVLFHGGGSPLS